MLLGTDIGIAQGDIVLDGYPSPPLKGAQKHCSTMHPHVSAHMSMSIVAKRLDAEFTEFTEFTDASMPHRQYWHE